MKKDQHIITKEHLRKDTTSSTYQLSLSINQKEIEVNLDPDDATLEKTIQLVNKVLGNFEFYYHDVSKFVHVPGQLDYILHFASPASPIDYLKMPIQTMKVGSLGTLNCLGLAKDKGARMLIASTSEVYGDPLVHPQKENYWGNVNPVGPRGVYDEAKGFKKHLPWRITPSMDWKQGW